jgi:hypothetical protein
MMRGVHRIQTELSSTSEITALVGADVPAGGPRASGGLV